MKSDTRTFSRVDLNKLYVIMEWDGQTWKPVTPRIKWSDAIRIIRQIRDAKPERKVTDYRIN